MSADTNRKPEDDEKKIREALRVAKRRAKTTPKSFDPELRENFWKNRYAPLISNVSAGTSAVIAASGVSAAREANAPYDWFVDWAKKDLPDSVAQGNTKAHIELEQRESTWLNKAKRAFWYVLGIIVTAIVSYYIALAGFKL